MDDETADYVPPPKPDHCQLCGRALEALTRHHLIPRARHRSKRNRRTFDRQDVRTRILWVCRPCHSHIHRRFTEKELENHYHSREALLADPEIQRFVAWIADREPGFKPKSPIRRRR